MRSQESTPKEILNDQLTELKKEQRHYKTFFNSKFLTNLDLVLEKCFLPSKDKKEHFITKEKLTLDFLKLVQSQKKFKDTSSICENLNSMAVLDLETNLCGRILSIDFLKKEVEFITLYNLREHAKSQTKSFNLIEFFDPRSVQMQHYYTLQSIKYDCFNYIDTFSFLTGKLESIDNFKCEQKKGTRISSLTGFSAMRLDSRYLANDIKD